MTNPLMLYIDDDACMRALVVQLVSAKGIRVHAVSDAPAALAWLKSQTELPAAILTDFNMPEIDGLTFVKFLRTTKRFAKIPALVVTAVEDRFLRAEADDLDCVGYVMKPIDINSFANTVLEAIRSGNRAPSDRQDFFSSLSVAA